MLEWWQVLGGPKIGISLQRYRGVIVAFDFPSFSSLLIPEPADAGLSLKPIKAL